GIETEEEGGKGRVGRGFFEDGNLEGAEPEPRAALDLDSRLDEAYLTLAQIAERRGKRGESLLLLAQAMELQGRLEAALGQYQKAAAVLGPDYPQAEQNDKEEADTKHVRRILQCVAVHVTRRG